MVLLKSFLLFCFIVLASSHSPTSFGMRGMTHRVGGGLFSWGRRRNSSLMTMCLQSCQDEERCPSMLEDDMDDDMESEEEEEEEEGECRQCVEEECGERNPSNRRRSFFCVLLAKRDCSACSNRRSSTAITKKARCATCLRRCSFENGGPRRGIFQRLSCFRNTKGSDSCPTLREIVSRIENLDGGCRNCVMAECGPFNRNDRSEILECISDAREDCNECPILTSEEQTRMRNCRSQLRDCLPRQASRNRSPFVRRPFAILSCINNCSQNQCPSPREFILRFLRLPLGCRNCVMSECPLRGRFRDRNLFADCISDARDQCSACPEMNDEDGVSPRTCHSCIASCVSPSKKCMPKPTIIGHQRGNGYMSSMAPSHGQPRQPRQPRLPRLPRLPRPLPSIGSTGFMGQRPFPNYMNGQNMQQGNQPSGFNQCQMCRRMCPGHFFGGWTNNPDTDDEEV